MKKLFTLFCAALLSSSAFADRFEVNDGNAYLMCTITSTSPAEVMIEYGYPSVTNLTIPETVTNAGTVYTVTSIGESSFADAHDLKTLVISNSVKTIYQGAFAGLSSLESVTLGDGVEVLEPGAFGECRNLSSINFGSSLKTIGDAAFAEVAITSLTIPNSVESIGAEAFRKCNNMLSVTIGNSVTSIDPVAFYRNPNLQSFSGKFASADHKCLIIDGRLVGFAPYGITEYTFPYGMTRIGQWTLYGCSELTSITLPSTVNFLENQTFDQCSGITKLQIKATTPPQLFSTNVFMGFSKSHCELIVPEGSEATYAATPGWDGFAAYTPTGIETVEADAAGASVRYYDLHGIEVDGDALASGLYIRRCGSRADKVLVK